MTDMTTTTTSHIDSWEDIKPYYLARVDELISEGGPGNDENFPEKEELVEWIGGLSLTDISNIVAIMYLRDEAASHNFLMASLLSKQTSAEVLN